MVRMTCLPSKLKVLGPKVRSPAKQTDPHYGSQAHKDWVKEVFKRSGGRCQWPGCTRSASESRMFADHIVERKDGGADLDPQNGWLLCGTHHTSKTAAERKKRLA